MTDIDLGFIALTDAAPLIVAHAHGHFEAEGLRVALHREVSWATIRDKVGAGLYQGAHMLAPMVMAARLGAGSDPSDIIAPLSLNAHGAAVGVSSALARAMDETHAAHANDALALVCASRRSAGQPAPSFAVVFPYSMHNYILRDWGAAAGLDPDRDLRIVVAAPTAIAARLRSGEIDGFAVGAPWGSACVAESNARLVLESGAFWPGGPDKMLALSNAWAARESEAALALTRAVLRAALWCDAPSNAQSLADLIAKHIGAPANLVAARFGAAETVSLRFARAAFPWRSQAAWQLSQMLRWGQIEPGADLEHALAGYRPDLYREAAAALGISAPKSDTKIEGAHDAEWAIPGTLGPIPMSADRFSSGAAFDPADPVGYAGEFPIGRLHKGSGA